MNDLFKKLIAVIILLLLILLFFSFFRNIQDIDNYAYVVAIGMDVGTTNTLKITFQTLSPSGSSSGSSGESSESSSSGGGSSSVITTSIECSSINSGIQLLNAYIGSKQLNLSHCQSITFSEKLAHIGITDYIYNFINNLKIPHDTKVVVSECDAEYYLINSESSYDKLISRYYKTASESGRYTGYTYPVKLVDFFSKLNDSFVEPTAILSSINIPQTGESSSYDDSFLRDSTYKAGQSPITSQSAGMEDVGLAVFKGGKLIGELTALETIAFLITSNNFDSCELTIVNPFDNESTIDFSLYKQKDTKNSVQFVNGSPYITSDIYLNANILSIGSNSNYLNNSILVDLENRLNLYIETFISEYLYKTSTTFNSDISGFGQYALPKFTTTSDLENYNWKENYQNSFFKVNVNTSIKSSNLLLET